VGNLSVHGHMAVHDSSLRQLILTASITSVSTKHLIIFDPNMLFNIDHRVVIPNYCLWIAYHVNCLPYYVLCQYILAKYTVIELLYTVKTDWLF